MKEIKQLEEEVLEAISTGDTKKLRGELSVKYNRIAHFLGSMMRAEDSLVEAKLYKEEVQAMKRLLDHSRELSVRSRAAYSFVVEMYNLGIYFASLAEVSKRHRSPKAKDIQGIMEDIDFLESQIKEVVSDKEIAIVEREAENTKRKILNRISMVDRLVHKYVLSKRAGQL